MTTKFANFAETTLSQAILAAATTIFVADADNFPTLTVGTDSARATIYDGVNLPEIVDITAITGTTLTVIRARESTAAVAWGAGAKIIIAPTAEQFQAIYNQTLTSGYFGTATGTNDITLTVTTIPAFVAGLLVSFITPSENTGPTRLRFTNGSTTTAYVDMVDPDGSDLESGDMLSNWLVTVQYDSVNSVWKLITPFGEHAHFTKINHAAFAFNYAANGNFGFWTAGSSFSNPASGSEVADDWYVRYDGTIGTFSVSRQAFTPGQTDVPGEPQYFLRWDHTAGGSGSTYRDIEWKDEQSARFQAGESAAFSFWVKGASAFSIDAQVIQDFGTGGSPSSAVTISTDTINVTTSWQKVSLIKDMSSVLGKTFGSNNDDTLKVRLKLPLNTTFRLDLANFQPERGDRVTAFNPGTTVPKVLPISRGGTGVAASSLAALLSGIGAQPLDAQLTDVAATSPTANNFLGGDGTNIVMRTPTQVRTSLGLATTDSPEFTAINLGHASDTTLARIAAGRISVEGSELSRLDATETFGGAKTFTTLPKVQPNGSGTTPPTTGSATTQVVFRAGAANVGAAGVGLDLFINTSTGTAYLQSHNWNDYTTNYTLDLNPVGGSVLAGGNTVYHAGNIGSTSHSFSATQDFSNTVSVASADTSIKNRASSGWIGLVGHSGGFGTAGAGAIIIRASGGVEHYTGSTRVFNANSSSVDIENVPLNVQGARANVSGKQCIPIPASSLTSRTTNGAAYGLTESSINKVMLPTYDFDQTTQEFVQFLVPMPKGWNEGTISAQFIWSATGGSGGVVWGIQAVALSDDDATDAAFGTAQTVADTLLAANDVHISAETSAVTIGGSPVEGDMVAFQIYRLPSDGSDTLNADARLIGIRLFITTNAANDA